MLRIQTMKTSADWMWAGLVALSTVSVAPGAVYSLTNGPGDGTVTVGVDGFGAFGSSIGEHASNALFDPVGAGVPTRTTFESGVAIRFASSGSRTFLTSGDIGGTGGLTNPVVTGTTTSGTSAFMVGGLSVGLTQTLTPIFTGLNQTGTMLIQSYVMTNPTMVGPLDFELVRYFDGDLRFDITSSDGGGRMSAAATDVLFQTDSATGTADPVTFVGITAEGGTTPANGRYEVDSFSGLRGAIVAGTVLDDTVAGDGPDSNQFIDFGPGYDVSLALNNRFSLAPGQTATYRTTTVFGTGTPEGEEVPEGGNLLIPIAAVVCGMLAMAGMARPSRQPARGRRRRGV